MVSLWGFIYAMRFGATFPWSEDPDSCVAVCPDSDTPVLFKIERIKNS
jgi:uncharacterized repeat protein (TIGR04076 family)